MNKPEKNPIRKNLETGGLIVADFIVKRLADGYFFIDGCIFQVSKKKAELKRRWLP